MTVEIRLARDAATQAQTLVAELLDEGIDVRSASDQDTDRGLETLAIDFTVALVAEATYGTVHDLVDRWLKKRHLEKDDIHLTLSDEDEPDVHDSTDEA